MSHAARSGQPAAFLIAAVNNLAVINDTFGFDVGDEIITGVGHLLKSKLRGGDILGRYSSNKFGIILADCNAGSARIAAERLMKAIRERRSARRPASCRQRYRSAECWSRSRPRRAEAANAALHALDAARMNGTTASRPTSRARPGRTHAAATSPSPTTSSRRSTRTGCSSALQPIVSTGPVSPRSTSACCGWTARRHSCPPAISSSSPSSWACRA